MRVQQVDLITIHTGIVFHLKKKKTLRNTLLCIIFMPLWKRLAEAAWNIRSVFPCKKEQRHWIWTTMKE